MENASKALEIAGIMFIGAIIISLAVYLFSSTGRSSEQFYKKMQENQINKFNEQFLKYNSLRTCTTHDIVTIANLAKDNNSKYDLDESDEGENSYYIKVWVKEGNYNILDNFESLTEEDYMIFISDSLEEIEDSSSSLEEQKKLTKVKQYECEVKISEKTKRVYQVNFTKI